MKEIRDYKPVIIGVDHGYGNIKTASVLVIIWMALNS